MGRIVTRSSTHKAIGGESSTPVQHNKATKAPTRKVKVSRHFFLTIKVVILYLFINASYKLLSFFRQRNILELLLKLFIT